MAVFGAGAMGTAFGLARGNEDSLEEPPAHTKFVFATTEPQAVIGTIKSRTHHYPFRLVPARAVAANLLSIGGEFVSAGGVQALVLRNPGTGAAAREFHAKVLRPHYVLLPNVRRDVRGLRPAARHALARDWVRSVTPGATLVSGEGSPAVRAAIRRECERRQVQLVEAVPLRNDVPGLECVSVLDAFLRQEAIREMVRVAGESGCTVHISHLKLAGIALWPIGKTIVPA